MRKEWLAGALALLVVAAVGYVWFAPPTREPAPDVALPILNGESLELSAYRGEPVMVVFWATSCPTCIDEMPQIVELYEALGADGFNVLGVAMDYDPVDRVNALVERKQLPYTIVVDEGGHIARAFNNVRVTPTTVLIDPAGGVVWQRIGHLDFPAIHKQIRDMLAAEQSAGLHCGLNPFTSSAW